jgi:hypothetical protein
MVIIRRTQCNFRASEPEKKDETLMKWFLLIFELEVETQFT